MKKWLSVWASTFLSVISYGILVWVTMKNSFHFTKNHLAENFQLPTPLPKVWVSAFPNESPMCNFILPDILMLNGSKGGAQKILNFM